MFVSFDPEVFEKNQAIKGCGQQKLFFIQWTSPPKYIEDFFLSLFGLGLWTEKS